MQKSYIGQQKQGSREERRRDKPTKEEEKRGWESMGKVSVKLLASVRITAWSTSPLLPPRGSCSIQYTIFSFLLNQEVFHSFMFLNIASGKRPGQVTRFIQGKRGGLGTALVRAAPHGWDRHFFFLKFQIYTFTQRLHICMYRHQRVNFDNFTSIVICITLYTYTVS